MLPHFQDMVDKIGEKGYFGGRFGVRMNMGGRPVICLGQYGAIFKQYIFTKKMWTHRGKCWLVPKYQGYGIMISAFQSQQFGLVYPLKVPDLQTIIYGYMLVIMQEGIHTLPLCTNCYMQATGQGDELQGRGQELEATTGGTGAEKHCGGLSGLWDIFGGDVGVQITWEGDHRLR